MRENRFSKATVKPTCVLRNKQVIKKRGVTTLCCDCSFFDPTKATKTGACRRFPPILIQRGNRHHKDYITINVLVGRSYTCNKSEIKSSHKVSSDKNSGPKCENCRFFDYSLIDLKENGFGRCKKYSPTLTIMKNKKLSSSSFEWPHVSARQYCGEFKKSNA